MNHTNHLNINREVEMLAAFFLTRRREGTKAQSFLFYASFEGKMIPTIKPLNQRSNLNLSNLPTISREVEMLAAFFLTQRREGTKAQSFLKTKM